MDMIEAIKRVVMGARDTGKSPEGDKPVKRLDIDVPSLLYRRPDLIFAPHDRVKIRHNRETGEIRVEEMPFIEKVYAGIMQDRWFPGDRQGINHLLAIEFMGDRSRSARARQVVAPIADRKGRVKIIRDLDIGKKCPKCGRELEKYYKGCPYCGIEL